MFELESNLKVLECSKETSPLPIPLALSPDNTKYPAPIGSPLLFSPGKPAILKNLSSPTGNTQSNSMSPYSPVIGTLTNPTFSSRSNSSSPNSSANCSPLETSPTSEYPYCETTLTGKVRKFPQLGPSPKKHCSPTNSSPFASLREHTSKQFEKENGSQFTDHTNGFTIDQSPFPAYDRVLSPKVRNDNNSILNFPLHSPIHTLRCTETLKDVKLREDTRDKGWTALQMETANTGKDLFNKAKHFVRNDTPSYYESFVPAE